MTRIFALLLLCSLCTSVFAQDDLFNTKVKKSPSRKGWVISIDGDLDFPMAAMAKDFGINYRLGGGIYYKTKSNWMFGAKGDFLTGNKIKTDSFMKNIEDPEGYIINSSGERVSLPVYERGYLFGLCFGKIFNTSKKIQDNGILWMNTIGFIQHKINIFVRNRDVPALQGNYVQGYDRLTNGGFLEEFVGYSYLAKNGLLNFFIGLDITGAITKDRRGYLYDVMRADNGTRFDMLAGIRGGIYLPIFKHKSEDLYFQ